MKKGRPTRRADISDLTALYKLYRGDGGSGEDAKVALSALEDSLKRIANEIDVEPSELYERRRSKSIVLSDLGRAIADDAVDFVDRAKDWRAIANAHRHGPQISIGIRAFHWDWVFRKVVEKIVSATGGNIMLDIRTDSYKGLRQRLQRGRLDVCVVYGGVRAGYLESYEKTRLTTQSQYPFVHWPSGVPATLRTLEYAITQPGFGYLKIDRDTKDFDRELLKKQQELSDFYLRPKFCFTDGTLAWQFFKSPAGIRTLGYFSHRKSELDAIKHNDNIRAYVEPRYEITRPLMAFRLRRSGSNEGDASRVVRTLEDAAQVWRDVRSGVFPILSRKAQDRDRLVDATYVEIKRALEHSGSS